MRPRENFSSGFMLDRRRKDGEDPGACMHAYSWFYMPLLGFGGAEEVV
jgi:hypothetical protein